MQFEVAGIFCYRSLCNAFLVKEDTDWVKNVYNMRWRAADQEIDQKGRGERLCKKIQARNLNKEDAMDRRR